MFALAVLLSAVAAASVLPVLYPQKNGPQTEAMPAYGPQAGVSPAYSSHAGESFEGVFVGGVFPGAVKPSDQDVAFIGVNYYYGSGGGYKNENAAKKSAEINGAITVKNVNFFPAETDNPIIVEKDKPVIAETDNHVIAGTDNPGTEEARVPLHMFENVLKRNKDVAGWIKIDNTNIDYPVLYDGSDYYLNHNIDRNKVTAGSIYLDPANDPFGDDYNLLIHGHRMKNGTMFKDVVKYKEESFFNSHRLIRFNTLYDEMLWEVFSIYVIDAGDEIVPIDFFGNSTVFLLYAKRFAERSMYKVDGLEFDSDDRILTLSTCSYETDNSRTILHARLISKNGSQIAARKP